MKRSIQLASIVFLLSAHQLVAQIYTDEVQVVEGLGGKVGIGTQSPSARLHIVTPEAITRESFRLYNTANTNNYLSLWQGTGGAALDPIGTGLLFLGYDQATTVVIGKVGGNLGVGTVSPTEKLDVTGSIALSGTANGVGIRRAQGTAGQSSPDLTIKGSTGFNQAASATGGAVTIQGGTGVGGWPGIGGTLRLLGGDSGGALYSFGGNVYCAGGAGGSSGAPGNVILGHNGSAAQGNVGIGMTPTQTLSVNGNASKSSAGSWVANSDARLKKNITQLKPEETLTKLLHLQGVTYEWDDDKTGIDRPEGIQYGFTAQNIRSVFPELVEEDNLGYLQTAYGTYDAMMIEALRALNEKIEKLEQENALLKQENLETSTSIASILKRLEQIETSSKNSRTDD